MVMGRGLRCTFSGTRPPFRMLHQHLSITVQRVTDQVTEHGTTPLDMCCETPPYMERDASVRDPPHFVT